MNSLSLRYDLIRTIGETLIGVAVVVALVVLVVVSLQICGHCNRVKGNQ